MDKKDMCQINDIVCLSSGSMCEIFEISRETLSKWVNDKGAPKVKKGWYPLSEFIIWYVKSKTPSDTDNTENMSFSQQKTYYEAKLKEQQVETAEIKNAIQKGEYIPRDDVVKELQRFFVSLKRSMEGYSRKVAMEVSPYLEPELVRSIEQNISDGTREALNQLSVRGVYSAKYKEPKKI